MRPLLACCLLLLSFSRNASAWDYVCTFPGAGLGSVSFLDMRLFRQAAGNGNFDYMIQIPVGVGARCMVPSFPEGKVSAKFYMTGGVVLETGLITRYHNGNDIKHVIKNQPYLECLDAEWHREFRCRF